MWAKVTPTPDAGEPWGFDNGAFVNWTEGRPFDAERFLRRLDAARELESDPILSVTPDIVGDPASLEFSLAWRERIGPDRWPWYLAVQDGMNYADVRAIAPNFAGLFLGGTTRFKSTAAQWCRLAHETGRKFHYARASTIQRVMDAREIGADSLDSCFPLWNLSRFAEFIAACEGQIRQPRLFPAGIVNLVCDELAGESA